MTRVCAGGLLLRGDTILLVKRAADRSFHPGVWDVPGGHCEADETPEQTLARELDEEIGVRPTTLREIAVLAEEAPLVHGPGAYHIFVVTAWEGGEPRLRAREHSELRWSTLGEAVQLTLAHSGYPDVFRAALRAAL